MAFQSKTYSLSDEVVAAIEDAKAKGESPNKFLRRVLGIDAQTGQYHANLTAQEMTGETVTVEPERYLDAIGPELSSGRGKASIETRRMRDKGDTER